MNINFLLLYDSKSLLFSILFASFRLLGRYCFDVILNENDKAVTKNSNILFIFIKIN